MFQLLQVNPKISSSSDASPLKLSPKDAEISFDKVNFSYLSGQPILNNLSFSVPAGKSYAIVGGMRKIEIISHE